MLRYIIKRLINMVPLLIGISFISFLVIHLAPGSPVSVSLFNPKISLEAREKLNKLYGLDKPVHIQYFNWLKNILKFDFGYSLVDGRKVSSKILERLPVTLTINILSLLIIFFTAIPLGLYSGWRKGSFFDRFTTIFVFIGFATPSFWLALLSMQFLGVKLGWFPISGITSIDFEYFPWYKKVLDFLWHISLPVLVASFGSLAGLSRYSREKFLEVLDKEYIRTAFAKGLPSSQIIYKHALKPVFLPVITILGLSVPGLLGGSVIFETIFSIPGMGRLFYEGVMMRDYPLIMGLLVIGAFLTLLGNFLADLAYIWADPRIKYSK
ncbi:MAG: ABC transporter permease [Candidatus Omnitrophica bacterium]|nr:ABC transporter permease [Candidatus Omnitrophota bacterium]